MNLPRVVLEYPAWVTDVVDWDTPLAGDAARMRLAIRLAHENVERGTGGPFGAVIFERDSGRIVGVGTNSVVRLHNSTLHGEMMAMMLAEYRTGSFSLAGSGSTQYELHSSCDPCAMCLGAILWGALGDAGLPVVLQLATSRATMARLPA